ncbi:hypothetical protein QN400_24585 [Pseudomonas sp. RTC3]|uniref:hypothetical protein n=1 Tax=Pseudomonas sp. 5C2 TaxID=3048588 RepID=UPI002AB4835C|nr:hypothetical protein [Pseudomonas sp. 5C2]MDY7566836.1 hypothetical protein [Pseudomonas sp. 5C2]MEB0065181.1 hypothetical protein [Pseudomonas sp. RTC3]MEB0243850.1 hypothetical protein [Pseudomonas sp. 5C2]
MFTPCHTITSDMVFDLDAQLNSLDAVAHVAVGRMDNPVLVAIAQGFLAPVALNHPTLNSFVEAELIAARLNNLQGISDRQRIAILRSLASVVGN